MEIRCQGVVPKHSTVELKFGPFLRPFQARFKYIVGEVSRAKDKPVDKKLAPYVFLHQLQIGDRSQFPDESTSTAVVNGRRLLPLSQPAKVPLTCFDIDGLAVKLHFDTITAQDDVTVRLSNEHSRDLYVVIRLAEMWPKRLEDVVIP